MDTIKELEVVAWQDAEDPLYTTGERRRMHGWATDGYPVVELCRLSDAKRAIAERDAIIERLETGIPRLQEHAHQMRQQRDRLMAENERLRKSCAGVIARSVHETRAATNSALDGYLAAGIAATDAELDKLRQQLAEANDDTSRWHEIACKQRKRADGLADQRAQPSDDVAKDAWIPVGERLPDGIVLAYYENSYNKSRIIRAKYVKKFTQESENIDDFDAQYDEETDTYYDAEGWYEMIDNWSDYSSVTITEGAVTHWMPLPAAPAIAAARKGEGE